MPIDDISVVNYIPRRVQLQVPEDGPNVTQTVKKDPARNTEVVITIVRRHGAVALVNPERRLVEVKLSVPRLRGGNYNFPLAALPQGAEGLPVEVIERFVTEATGWSEPPSVLGWPVRNVAFAIDINVGFENMRPALHALAAIRRAYSSRSVEWRDTAARLTGVRFGGDRYRAVFYSKEAEVLNRVEQLLRRQDPFPRRRLDERRALAEQARGVIRFEVTLRGAEEVRSVYGLPAGHQPTLRLVAEPGVGEYVLAGELRQMRLDLLDPPDDQHEEHGVRALLFEVLRNAQSFNADDGPKNSKRSRVSLVRALALFGYYVAMAEANRDEVTAAWNDSGESSLFDIERDLRALKMPNVGNVSREPLRRLEQFMDVLRGEMPNFPTAPPPMPVEPYASGWLADAPWAAHVDDLPDIPGLGIDDVTADDEHAST